MIIDRKLRETVAGVMLEEMLSLNGQRGIPKPTAENMKVSQRMDGPMLAFLIEKNFNRIDLNGDGISRKELATAMATPQKFTNDEWAMLRLITRYFDSIAALCDDQTEGEKVRITKMDKDVLIQFLQFSNMTMQNIHDWLSLNERSVAPPPSSGST